MKLAETIVQSGIELKNGNSIRDGTINFVGEKLIIKSQKGIVLSVAALVIAIVVVGLASTIADYQQDFGKNAKYTVGIDRVAYKYENLQDNVIDILNNVGQIFYVADENSIVVSETLPNKKGSNNYTDALQEYKEFALRYRDNLDININIDSLDLNQIVFEPYGIVYGHSSQGSKKDYLNEMHYYPGSVNFNEYTVDVYLQNQNFKEITSNIMTTSGGIGLNVNVYNCKSCDANSFEYENIDPNETSWVIIETSGEATKDVNVVISPVGNMSVVNFNSVPIDLNTTINFPAMATLPEIALPENFIVVDDNSLGVRKR